MKSFVGVLPAVLTSFEDNQIDEKGVRSLVNYLIDSGVHGLYPCGTTGEGMLLDLSERRRVAEIVLAEARGKVPVMVHVGCISTHKTIELALHARDNGADAIGVIAPFFYLVDEEGLIQHYKLVSRAVSDIPVYIYNLPGNTRNDVTADVVSAVIESCPNVVGVKDSSKDIEKLKEYMKIGGRNLTVFVGSDALILPALNEGAAGVVSAVANAFPREVIAVYDAYKKGDMERAVGLQKRVNDLRTILKDGPYIAPYKAALRMKGIEFGGMRSPLREMSKQEDDKLRERLENIGVI